MTTMSGRSLSQKAARVLYDNYNGDLTTFSHPSVLTEMYAKKFVFLINYTHPMTIMHDVLTNWSSLSTYNIA